MKNISGIAIVLIIIAAAGGFYGGMKYQESKSPSAGRFMIEQGGQRTIGQGGTGFRPVTGEIISADNTSITVKTQDGDSKIIIISAKTSINKSSEGSKTDLKVGESVAVFGTENTDGSVTAQNVQMNPQTRNNPVTDPPKN